MTPKVRTHWLLSVLCSLPLIAINACADDEDDHDHDTTTSGTDTNSQSDTETSSHTNHTSTGSESTQTDSGNTSDSTNTPTQSDATGSTDSSSTSSDTPSDNTDSTGTGDDSVHGCTLADATDHTGKATVELDWSNPHTSCIVVSPNTMVTWLGDFSVHPLVGGMSPTNDATSLISSSDQSGASATVTFADVGTYPYFCEVHAVAMQGVVYVAE